MLQKQWKGAIEERQSEFGFLSTLNSMFNFQFSLSTLCQFCQLALVGVVL